MARQLHGIEKGIRLYAENSDSSFIDILFGAAAPGGDAGVQDDASIGSWYYRTDGTSYQKTADTNATSDWTLNGAGNAQIGVFRPEKVIAATTDAAPSSGASIDLVENPFGDDASPTLVAADFAVNDYIIFDADGTPKLMRVSAISAPSITVVDASLPLVEGDGFLVKYYLPDGPDAQEKQALVTYSGGLIVKIGDFNFSFADGISLATSYASQNGTLSNADTVNSAIEKLDGNQQDLVTLSGVALGSTNLGTFTGTVIPDNQNVKQALQALETFVEDGGRTSASGVTTAAVLDSVLVDAVAATKWYVVIKRNSAPANTQAIEVWATHNGTASADATLVDDTVYSKLKLGGNFNYTVSVVINGTGAAQTMRLQVASSEVGGIDVYATREEVQF
jgi:hypothetical protein